MAWAWSCAAEMKECDYDVTSELLLAASNDDNDAYRREVQLQVKHLPVYYYYYYYYYRSSRCR